METKKSLRDFEKILKALANRRRLAILIYLHRAHVAHVGRIAEEIKLSFRSTSRHLALLSAAEVVEREQTGLIVNYRLSTPLHPIVKTLLVLL